MSVVALRLAGPLQSWGSGSRFVRRGTEREPTKSGVLGLVAAARGLRREDPLEELLGLRYGVRVDRPGQLLRDFHTAQRPKRERDGSVTWRSLPLSQRYYLSDAVFLAVLEGDRALVEGIDEALRAPHFPLYLGRRSCPPAGPVALGTADGDVEQALATWPWQASVRVQRAHRERTVWLATIRDAKPGTPEAEPVRDMPVSFDPNRREYTWRSVVRGTVEIPNEHGTVPATGVHDPMSLLGE
ncbi:CRISPR-associated Cas5e family protein [Prauserella shujinwangii]|uniref:CRISPR-associated Cas5e family protein n=1 Tax=Prauserella shujinwangii TaxID=1453103 RepID=A0A2T0M2V6_9PSEU|nr:type I-E CRISPR-associated protein Cas5/CasD [Prauserella shujinwangii]PRX51083.1 CRISPR-associated Cas5e family protein [Prauserella shujinwangii]